jgi:hypothetical protein
MLTKPNSILLMVFVVRICICLDYILLYETEYSSASEVSDCMYYTEHGQTIPYCRHSGGIWTTGWDYTSCQNDGTMWYFDELIDANITPSEVLKWSSSVESADNYAAIYYDRSKRCNDCFVCECTKSGSFGSFCQYQLNQYAESFKQAIDAQYEQRSDPYGIQEHGSIICYTTLECNYSLLCLDWRDICDGQQQCMFGLDEENCDKLEFNECDQDEYRCDNGMCIAEEYWLDGAFNPYIAGEWYEYTRKYIF